MSFTDESFKFNSVDYGGSNYLVIVTSRREVVLPAPRIDSQDLAAIDGVAAQGSTWGARTLEYSCQVAAASDTDRDTKIAAIASKLKSADTGEHPLVLGWKSSKTIQARLDSEFAPDVYFAGFDFRIAFLCPDPWFKATSQTNESDAISGDTTKVYTVLGDRDVRDNVFTIKNTDAALSGTLTLQGITSGELIQYTGVLGNGDWLRFTRETGAVELSVNSGSNWTGINANISGTIPRLLGGQSNSIKVFNLTAGTLLLDYYARSL